MTEAARCQRKNFLLRTVEEGKDDRQNGLSARVMIKMSLLNRDELLSNAIER